MLQNIESYKLIDYDSFIHHNEFKTPDYIERFFKRLGVVSIEEKNISKILTLYLPVNRHDFLTKVLQNFTDDFCLEVEPQCQDCVLHTSCDYFNKKNDWLSV